MEEVKVDPMAAKHEMFALLKAKLKAKVSTAEESVDAVQTLPLNPEDADAPSLHPGWPQPNLLWLQGLKNIS